MSVQNDEMTVVENVNHPGKTSRVNAVKYEAMRNLVLDLLPSSPPGLTQNEFIKEVAKNAPQEHWPRGEKSAWWMKTVQLDLEAKGIIHRTKTKPLTWYKSK